MLPFAGSPTQHGKIPARGDAISAGSSVIGIELGETGNAGSSAAVGDAPAVVM